LELRHFSLRQQQHLLEQDRVVGKIVGASSLLKFAYGLSDFAV